MCCPPKIWTIFLFIKKLQDKKILKPNCFWENYKSKNSFITLNEFYIKIESYDEDTGFCDFQIEFQQSKLSFPVRTDPQFSQLTLARLLHSLKLKWV